MKTKLIATIIGLALLVSACGDGGDTGGIANRPGATDGPRGRSSALQTPDVTQAPEGRANPPKDGTYTYEFTGESTNASRPTATPARAPADSEFISKVSSDGDVITYEDSTSLAQSVTTIRQRWSDDRVVELSFSFRTNQAPEPQGCEPNEPILVMRFPFKEEEFPQQSYEGEGAACDRTRNIAAEGTAMTKDANGVEWPTWLYHVETVTRSPGLTETYKEDRWFSPDLGKDIEIRAEVEGITEGGKVSYHAETKSLLKQHPA